MEKDFIIEAKNVKEPKKREQVRLSEGEIADLKRIIANLGNDIDELSLQKDLLIIENNKLRDLLRECWAHLSVGKVGTSVTPINILLNQISTALNETRANPTDCNKMQESEV